MKKKLNDHVAVNSVELGGWEYDEDYYKRPTSYIVNLDFYGYECQMTFRTADLRRAEKGEGLSNSGCYVYRPLFDSAYTYFEENIIEAIEVMKLMEEVWEGYWRRHSPYNYMGVKYE